MKWSTDTSDDDFWLCPAKHGIATRMPKEAAWNRNTEARGGVRRCRSAVELLGY